MYLLIKEAAPSSADPLWGGMNDDPLTHLLRTKLAEAGRVARGDVDSPYELQVGVPIPTSSPGSVGRWRVGWIFSLFINSKIGFQTILTEFFYSAGL